MMESAALIGQSLFSLRCVLTISSVPRMSFREGKTISTGCGLAISVILLLLVLVLDGKEISFSKVWWEVA